MRVSAGALMIVLALAGCATQRREPGLLGAPSGAARSVVAVEVTNDLGRTIDVYYSSQFLGRLAPYAHRRYPVPPTTGRVPLYAKFTSGVGSERTMNIARGRMVRYVYDEPQP